MSSGWVRTLIVAAGLSLATAGVLHAQDAPAGQSVQAVTVDRVLVRGNERIDDDAIRVVSMLQGNQRVSSPDIQNAIRRLMATGNYESVEIFVDETAGGGVDLVIDVVERPYVLSFEFTGLERISAREVRDTAGLQGEQPLNPQAIVRTERLIRDLLGAQGVQLAGIDTSMTPVQNLENTYIVTFHVEEGNRLAIADIQFEGNAAFNDDALKGAMQTKEEGFLWFRTGQFDRTVFDEDLLFNLPEFYGAHGYIDFTVVSDTLMIDPRSGKARIVIAVDEGPQYRLGNFEIVGAQRFPREQLEQMLRSQRRSVLGLPFGSTDEAERGEVFDQAALMAATQRVQELYANAGYIYASVEPILERTTGPNGEPVVDVTWAISEQSPFYVNRITIEGNTFTHESVIRDQIVIFPGDIYNMDRVIQSYRSIAALGFFETPLPEPDIRPNPENGTVDIVFRVAEMQTAQIQFGTSIGGGGYGRAGGLSGFIGFSHPNLFGQAKQASLQAEYGYGRSSFTASYTDPNLFGSRNSASVGVFHTDDRYRNVSFSDGRYVRTGANFRYGFPLGNLRFTRAFAGYSISHYSYHARNEDDCEPGDIFCQPSALGSNLSLAVTRDTKDHPLFPTIGSRQNVTVQQTGGPLGGDGNFQKLTGNLEWWVPVGLLGGGGGGAPIRMSFGLGARGGAIFGDASNFPIERFFLGGTQYGEPLRGYDESSITPFGYFEGGSIPSGQRLGDAFLTVSAEYAIRLSDMISVSAFGDAGNIWRDVGSVNPSKLFRSLGVGATVMTPFGPLGIDMAYGFDRPDPGWKFHFKITQPGL